MAQLKASVRQLLSSQRPREAQVLLASAADAASDPELWMLRGLASGLAGDATEAERCFCEAVRLQPAWPEAHYNLGQALLSQGNQRAAARAFVEAIRLQPDNAQAVAAFRWVDRRRWGGERVAVDIEGGLRVVCPRSLQCITTYVLLEQEDWFEPEIRFVRRYLRPGMKAVDVGANHGVYTLAMAQAVGSTGQVWAFEPASEPGQCLAESLALNSLSNVTLTRAALSDCRGEGRLLLDESSELNRLAEEAPAGGASVETVPLSTLDECAGEFRWHDMDFLKLDAEGAEAKIIAGGRVFLSRASPLVMFEILHGANVNLDLVKHFHAIGYESYRHVPGIAALVPWSAEESGQFPQLNLFCARPDRAEWLAQRGLLVRREEMTGDPPAAKGAWISLARELPCFRSMKSGASNVPDAAREKAGEVADDYDAALDHYATSQGDLPVAERFRALKEAWRLADQALRARWSPERAAALARIASSFGLIEVSLRALDSLMRRLPAEKFSIPLPLLPVSHHFDAIAMDAYASPADWFRGSVLETWERTRSWSSLWASADPFGALARLRAMALPCTPEMERRWKLVALVKGVALEPKGHLKTVGTAARNRFFWEGDADKYLYLE